jgi:hypothetical protein
MCGFLEEILEQLVTLVLFAIAAGGILFGLHFALQDKEIGPPWTYVIGVGTIQITVILWMLYCGFDPLAIGGVVVITGVIGGAILLCYLIDRAKKADRAVPYGQDKRTD